jgi:hypothetical protein
MTFRAFSSLAFVVALGSAGWAGSSWYNDDPSQWSGTQIFQILHNSPWTKTLKVDVPFPGQESFGNQSSGNTTVNNSPPPGAGGVGRRGMGGGSRQRTYSSGGGGGGNSNASVRSGPTEVTVQWQSALVVRMAAAKKNGEAANPASFKAGDEYVIAIIGLPITAVGGPAASADSANTLSPEQEQRLENHVKSSASIVRSHGALQPTKVEFDQGFDGRMLLHFPKSDPITAAEKSVEFRLALTKGELRKKFELKEMEYQGKLEL